VSTNTILQLTLKNWKTCGIPQKHKRIHHIYFIFLLNILFLARLWSTFTEIRSDCIRTQMCLPEPLKCLLLKTNCSLATNCKLSADLHFYTEKAETILYRGIQGGSNMTGTDLCVNKPHCAAAVRP